MNDKQNHKFFIAFTRHLIQTVWQRWIPQGHILKSLALASKVKSLALASKPQVLENCLVLGSRTALCFKLLKFVDRLKKFLKTHFFGERLKKNFEDLFFWRTLSLMSLVLGLGIPVLGLERVSPRKGCPWP